jgi:hypothetical protein
MTGLPYNTRAWPPGRRGAGVVEQGCLLSSCAGNGTGGSNPPLSARFFEIPQTQSEPQCRKSGMGLSKKRAPPATKATEGALSVHPF